MPDPATLVTQPRQMRPLLVVVLVGVLSVLGVVAAAGAGPWQADPRAVDGQIDRLGTTHQAPDTDTQEDGEPPKTPDPPGGGINIIGILFTGLAVASVLLAVYLAKRLRDKHNVTSPEPVVDDVDLLPADDVPIAPDVPALRRGAAAARSVLDKKAVPTDAIIAAWVELEEAAASSGVPRHPAQTPSEFTAAILAATTAEEAAATELLTLYRRARFAAGDKSGAHEVARASECLTRLAESWQDSG